MSIWIKLGDAEPFKATNVKTSDAYAQRLLCAIADVPISRYMNSPPRTLNADEMQRILDASDLLQKVPILIGKFTGAPPLKAMVIPLPRGKDILNPPGRSEGK